MRGLIAVTVLTLALFRSGHLYRARLNLSLLDEAPALLGRLATAVAIVATVIALRHQSESVANFLREAAVAARAAAARSGSHDKPDQGSATSRVGGPSDTATRWGQAGTGPNQVLTHHPEHGLRPVGFLDDNDVTFPADQFAPHLGNLEDIASVVRRCQVKVLLVADGQFDESTLAEMTRLDGPDRCALMVVPRLHQFHTQAGIPDHVGSIPVMRIRTPALHGPSQLAKRVFDLIVSATTIVLFSPVLLLCALLVRLEGGPGIIFRQQRVGRNGRLFDLYKFRTLTPSDESESATAWNISNDSRMGPVGRLLRKISAERVAAALEYFPGRYDACRTETRTSLLR